MDTVMDSDSERVQDELPPFTFVDVSFASVKREYLGDPESESYDVTVPLLKNPDDSNASKNQNFIEEKDLTKMVIKQEVEVSETDFSITENDSIVKELGCVSHSDVVPCGNEMKHSCDELTTNVEGNMFLDTGHMADIHCNQNKTTDGAVSTFCSEDCSTEENQDIQVKIEAICEPDLKVENPPLTQLDVEDNESSLQEANDESSCVDSVLKVNCGFGVTTTTFDKLQASSIVQRISSELQRILKKCKRKKEESSNSSLSDDVICSKVKCEQVPVHATDKVHLGNGNSRVEQHSRNLISEKSFSCGVCDASFRHPSTLEIHMRIHMGPKPFKCAECDVSFSRGRDLEVHTRIHSGEKPYKCGVCDVSFNQRCDLKVHMRIHTGEKPYKCGVCDVSFNQRGYLKVHMRIHTGEKPFKCNVCEYSSCRKLDLMNHMRTHSGEKPFKCVVCNNSFKHRGNLKIHMRIHTGEKPFKCDVCDYYSCRKQDLVVHMRIHSGEKPFKCGVCDVSFNRKSSLNTHMRIHTGEKPFKCGVCDVSFNQKGNLQVHLRNHTGEKPFKCDVCNVSFSLRGNLNVHLRMHSGEQPFKCGLCDVSFSVKGSLNSHMRTSHAGEKPFK